MYSVKMSISSCTQCYRQLWQRLSSIYNTHTTGTIKLCQGSNADLGQLIYTIFSVQLWLKSFLEQVRNPFITAGFTFYFFLPVQSLAVITGASFTGQPLNWSGWDLLQRINGSPGWERWGLLSLLLLHLHLCFHHPSPNVLFWASLNLSGKRLTGDDHFR